MFSVNALVYGGDTTLTKRCIGSIVDTLDASCVADLRIGLNAVTSDVLTLVVRETRDLPVDVHLYEESQCKNVMKYPMMRRMLYDIKRPLLGSHVMWFDDDSYVTGGKQFWADAAEAMSAGRSPVMGSVYYPGYNWSDMEMAAFTKQPWFGDKAFVPKTPFVTGGWWMADLEFLSKWDYPFRELRHNGGDTLLGELMRQQGHHPVMYRAGVAINADAQGRESKAPRRGVTTCRPFDMRTPYDYSHNDFQLQVSSIWKSKG